MMKWWCKLLVSSEALTVSCSWTRVVQLLFLYQAAVTKKCFKKKITLNIKINVACCLCSNHYLNKKIITCWALSCFFFQLFFLLFKHLLIFYNSESPALTVFLFLFALWLKIPHILLISINPPSASFLASSSYLLQTCWAFIATHFLFVFPSKYEMTMRALTFKKDLLPEMERKHAGLHWRTFTGCNRAEKNIVINGTSNYVYQHHVMVTRFVLIGLLILTVSLQSFIFQHMMLNKQTSAYINCVSQGQEVSIK